MANVNYEVNQIRTAVYGEEVREALISAIQKVGVEGTNLTNLLDSVESELDERVRRNTANIELKGDNLYFDEEEKLLYLVSNGQVIGDGIAVSTGGGGGGGGGGSVIFFKPTLTNDLPDRLITTTTGVDVNLKFTYTSVDETGADDGAGVGRIVVGGVTKKTFKANQGSNTINITDVVEPGTNSVSVKVENSEGTIRSLNYTVTIVILELTTTVEPISDYRGSATIYYTVSGSGEKIVHFVLDGAEIGTETVTTSGRSRAYTVDEQSHGSHILEIYATSVVDNLELESDHLRLCMYWIGASSDPIIATPFNTTEVTEGEIISIPYAVYDPTVEPATVTLSVIDGEGEIYSEKTIQKDRSAGDSWVISDYPSGNVTFRIACGTSHKDIRIAVEEYNFPIEPLTDSLVLEFTANGRSNNESNPGTWTYKDGISATFEGVSWSAADGWLHDEANDALLRMLPGSGATFTFKPFENDIRSSGYTIDVDFATRDVRDYTSVIISCMNSGRGFNITSQKASLTSEQSAVSMTFKEDSRVRVSFVVEQSTQNRLVFVYVNAVMCGAIQYPTNDNFAQAVADMIHFGSETCGLDLYKFRLYNKSLSRDEILDSYILDMPTLRQRQEAYTNNHILNASKNVSIDDLPSDLPYMVFSGAELPQSKGDKKTMTITFVDKVTPSRSFVSVGSIVDVQGTSSAKYPVKNLKSKSKEGFENNGATAEAYALRPGDVPVNSFCIKVDYASSEGANNVELVQIYEELCAELGLQSPAQKDYPGEGIRQGIAGRPIALFWHDTVHNETIFVGKANFNNDKGTPETFGFDKYPAAEAWDFRINTSDMCLFRDADFSTDAWKDSLESIYPEDYFNTTAIRRPFEFVVAHDPESVSTEEERAALMADFKAHLGDYFIVDNLLLYYLFTEVFLMIDSRAKNIHLATYDGIHWLPIPYDMDTAAGIKLKSVPG